MLKRNIIMLSLDEVRPDHLSCYGYTKMSTPHIDRVAKEGVRFETCICSSDLTPVTMGTVVTGKYPNKHGLREPYHQITGPSIGAILKEKGYVTAGFVGNGLLSRRHRYAEGFDYWNEASKDTSFTFLDYPDDKEEIFYEGNFWLDDFFNWLEHHAKELFFMWGHLYETHESSEHTLLQRGLIKEGELSEFGYYDAKIKMADEKLIGRLLVTLDKLGISKNTILVVMSDHGTNLGEHPCKDIPWRKGGVKYPQHTTMYDHDLKVAMMIRGEGLPEGKKVRGMVGSVSLVPTLLDLVGVSTRDYDFDGSSLLPAIEKGEIKGAEVYSEDLFEARGEGALQSIRTDDVKLIRNLTLGTEEFYDLRKDPQEKNNLVETIDKEQKIGLRKKLNARLTSGVSGGRAFSKTEKEQIDQRLRRLGYIK